MSLFYGSEIYSVDSKGRINIPLRMRKHLAKSSGTFIVTCNVLEPCLFLYSEKEWEKYHEQLIKLSTHSDENDFKVMNWIGDHTEVCKIGAQSKIMLSAKMLDYAKITKEVKIVGAADKLILWDPKTYDKYSLSMSDVKSLFPKVFSRNGN